MIRPNRFLVWVLNLFAFGAAGCFSGTPSAESAKFAEPDGFRRWVGTWSDGEKSKVQIDASGHFEANLTYKGDIVLPYEDYWKSASVAGELSTDVRSCRTFEYSLNGIGCCFINQFGGGANYDYHLRMQLCPETEELVVEYDEGVNKRFRLKRSCSTSEVRRGE